MVVEAAALAHAALAQVPGLLGPPAYRAGVPAEDSKGLRLAVVGEAMACKVAVTDPDIQGFEIGSPLSVAGWAEQGANGVLCWRQTALMERPPADARTAPGSVLSAAVVCRGPRHSQPLKLDVVCCKASYGTPHHAEFAVLACSERRTSNATGVEKLRTRAGWHRLPAGPASTSSRLLPPRCCRAGCAQHSGALCVSSLSCACPSSVLLGRPVLSFADMIARAGMRSIPADLHRLGPDSCARPPRPRLHHQIQG